ncbi:hypothetical protein LTS12_027930, partial [Elasticomyces elasticus]
NTQQEASQSDAADVRTWLDHIPIDRVVTRLQQTFTPSQPKSSILDCLTNPQAHPYVAAQKILEDLGDSLEGAAVTSALVFRYVQHHELWRGHPDGTVTSAEAFLNTLGNSTYVKAAIVIGTSSDLARHKSLKAIEERWGQDWFDRLPDDLRSPEWLAPQQCSLQLLDAIVKASQSCGFDDAVTQWRQSMERRTDEDVRQREKIRHPRTRNVILDDVRRSIRGGSRGDIHSKLKAIGGDYFRVQHVAPRGPPIEKGGRTLPVAAAKRSGKRVREASPNHPVSENSETEDGWRRAADGTTMVPRGAKNVLIRKPIPSQTSTASTMPTCDGHAVARVIHQLVETYEDLLPLDQNVEGGHALCRSCRPVTLRAFEALEEILIPCVRELLAVDKHRFDSDEDVLLSQLTEDSQPARPLKRKRPQIPDSSNEST